MIEINESDIGNRYVNIISEIPDNHEIFEQFIAAILGWA